MPAGAVAKDLVRVFEGLGWFASPQRQFANWWVTSASAPEVTVFQWGGHNVTLARQDEQEMGRARKEQMKKKATAERKANEEATRACGSRDDPWAGKGPQGLRKETPKAADPLEKGTPGRATKKRLCK